jgi:hypothetical protein
MYYIGLDVHKRTISYCLKDGSGAIHAQGTIPATRFDLDRWMKTLPQPWSAAILDKDLSWKSANRTTDSEKFSLDRTPTVHRSAHSGPEVDPS